MSDSIVKSNWSAPFQPTSAQQDFIDNGDFFPTQQTFLGASITSFSVSGGDGSTKSSLNVNLVEDGGFNGNLHKDGSKIDPYHTGSGDSFNPPGVGMPVFFAYSNPTQSITEAFTSPVANTNGFIFGGILESFHRTRSTGGRTFSVTVGDPREILQNVYLILNHSDVKVGLNEHNIFNAFGFLEYNPSLSTKGIFDAYTANPLSRGANAWSGDDMYYSAVSVINNDSGNYFSGLGFATKFPITGTGMSRRNSSGIPLYRIMQALGAMSKTVPDEYLGFTSGIVYRGLSYNVQLNNFPSISPFYCFDHDNIDYFTFISEIAEASGSELVVSLSPRSGDKVGGTIEISFIDRSMETSIGAINTFINGLTEKVEKDDIGYELANPTTSKVLFGANRVDLYAFTSCHDDDRTANANNQAGRAGAFNVNNQILPFYGTISEGVASPVKGTGNWTQILLDSSGLGAFGVGNYYIATEVELRYANKSFEAWKNFIEFFNGKFIEKLVTNPRARYQDIFMDGGGLRIEDSDGVSVRGLKVPRSLWAGTLGDPCFAPYGFPLYWGRGTAIGLTLQDVVDARYSVITDLEVLSTSVNASEETVQKVANAMLDKYKRLSRTRRLTQAEIDLMRSIRDGNFDQEYLIDAATELRSQVQTNTKVENRKENATKVFNFVKKIASEHYGKKWLVRIPSKPNFEFQPKPKVNGTIYEQGPFGFPPRAANIIADPAQATGSASSFVEASNNPVITDAQSNFHQTLVTNYNPIDDQLLHNFIPDTAGGFFTKRAYVEAANSVLMPINLTGFGSSHRIRSFVRYDHIDKLSIGTNKCYTEELGQTRVGKIPSKTQGTHGYNASANKDAKVAFIPVDMDDSYYFLPRLTSVSSPVYGNNFRVQTKSIANPITPDADGKLNEGAGGVKIIRRVVPTIQSSGRANVPVYTNTPDTNRGFVLITMPEQVNIKLEKISDIPVLNHFPPATYVGVAGFNDFVINTVTTTKVNKRIDFQNYGASMTFYNPNRLLSAPAAIKPDVVVLPLRNEQACYGPWYNGPIKMKEADGNFVYKTIKNLGGKVDIENDSGLAPWNYGSYELMNAAGQARTELAATLFLASERGSVTFPGMPPGVNTVGNLIASSGPIIDSISLDIGVGGVHTNYKFQTYQRSYGLLKKQQQKSLDLTKRMVLKGAEAQFELGAKGLTKAKFRGGLPARQVKPYESFYEAPSYSHNKKRVGFLGLVNPSNPRKDVTKFASQAASMNSKQLQDYADTLDDGVKALKDDYLSATEDVSDKEIAASYEDHPVVPSIVSADGRMLEELYTQPGDPYDIESYDLTYWS